MVFWHRAWAYHFGDHCSAHYTQLTKELIKSASFVTFPNIIREDSSSARLCLLLIPFLVFPNALFACRGQDLVWF